MARLDLPESRLKLRKRRRRIRVALLVAGALLTLCAAFVGFTYLPGLQIRSVVVAGAQTVSSSTIERSINETLDEHYVWVVPKRNILFYPRNTLNRTLLAAHPELASVDVHARDFRTIEALLVERQPRALWCAAEACYFMDENGVVYAEAPRFSEPVYIPYYGTADGGALPKQFLSPESFQALSALVDAVGQKLPAQQVRSVSVDDHKDAEVTFENGFVLRFSLNDHGGDVFERFSLALSSEPLQAHPLSDFVYLDLRFGDKLYYKLKHE